ncbi:uncharacterized protein LODBEIA_P32620 [Lodderomyces beijingensis]|uniref:RING-type domain-containing protein n=1 Tax=Lodderomyces beijingensis TaxID=1775926 RepID=A0ABP0ZLK8_9ASCO
MSTYEEEHNISSEPRQTQQERGRSHETLSEIIDSFIHNSHANNAPSEPSIDTLAAALNQLRTLDNSELATSLLSIISSDPTTRKPNAGVPSDFIDTLERVPVGSLPESESCSICTNNYHQDKYPLVVKLPCGNSHIFDLECISPWLSLNSTCPLCRVDVMEVGEIRRRKVEAEVKRAKEEDSEEELEEGWDVYG